MSNLAELNPHLFAALDRLDVETLTPEQIDAEVARAGAIVDVADRITENAKVGLQAAKLYAEHGDKILGHLPMIGKQREGGGEVRGSPIHYSDEELGWIKACSDMPRPETHALFVQVYNRPDVSLSNFNALCKRNGWLTGRTGRFVKGQVAHNAGKSFCPAGIEKGWFKAGERRGVATKLYRPIGTERVSKDGYRERKVNDDLPLQRRWRAVHVIEWEAINGPLPVGHCLKCLDGDRLNTDPANWVCIPRAVLPRLNGRFGRDYDNAPAELKPTILAVARLEHAAREARGSRP